jgi:cell division cycle 2-like
LLNGNALFTGESAAGQLNCIAKILGMPTENEWPGVSKLPLFKKVNVSQAGSCNRLHELFSESHNMHKIHSNSLMSHGDNGNKVHMQKLYLSELGLDLLKGLLTYNPKSRLSASAALKHPWFAEMPLPSRPEELPHPAQQQDGSKG